MSSEAKRRATYQDVLDAPENVVAEVIDGVLYTQPRPRMSHAAVATGLSARLWDAFHRGRSGPGGWIIVNEPELHLGDEPDILVPDIGGWQASRFPEDVDGDTAYLTVPPDWVCEILSPSTARKDRTLKLPLYARQGVSHAWLIDPATRVLEVLRLDGTSWRLVESHADGAVIRAEPFDAIELALGELWFSAGGVAKRED